MSEVQKPLTGLWVENPQTPEGKYLVVRRDGTIPGWPHFVLGARDPAAPWALRAYAVAGFFYGFNWKFLAGVWRAAKRFRRYRRNHGAGDPDRGRHRQDDPATIALMRLGKSS